ncbi:LacI family DNA-binding transcriptional regulator [Paenibacillus lutimineralis]|uniref:LacI family DNA-binding transcriptional regulator n=1 Tax=Paenibacillus lutimineralis TaxID=2707005 RepID=A0A3Q9IF26_9BACL|nr:LacI family DNA-binding transcriptional regulator [Paenibacillus lutimineralis]AZS17677.1 LacI family DNA-binding transcriptional regulator [Paenibacillus lutimineralis]
MPNIKQIAEAAGVSVSTVSRVLNKHPYVSEAKRKAVEEAIERLQYARNMNAVHLIKGITQTVAVILPHINHPYFMRLMEGIASEALKYNYQLILCQSRYSLDEEMKVLEMLKNKQIDGIIITSRSASLDQIEPYSAYGPILLCEDVKDRRLSSVYYDHYLSFQTAITFLWEKGHRNIGFALNRLNNSSGRKRISAYYDTLQTLGGNGRAEWMLDGYRDMKDSAAIFPWLHSLDERPTALLIAGDEVAAGVLLTAPQYGFRVPEDIAIIGFDNQPISELLGITTIDIQLSNIGARAFAIIYKQITDRTLEPASENLQFKLIERKTV